MRDLRVNTESIGLSTAIAPADHSYESEGVALGGISSYQGTPTVSLASVLTSSHEPGTEHVFAHGGVHGATVSVTKDRDTNMIEVGRQVAPIGQSAPA